MMKPLNEKELIYVQSRLSGMNKTRSALAAGYSKATAAQQANVIEKRPHIIQSIQTGIQDVGSTYLEAIKPFKDALKATKIAIDKETGEQYDTGIPDHTTRMAAGKQFLKLLGKDKDLTETPKHISSNPLTYKLEKGDEVELQRAVFRKAED